MKTSIPPSLFPALKWGWMVLALFAAFPDQATAHSHFAIGVEDTNGNNTADPGEPLRFIGESGTARTFHLLPRPFGQRPIQRCGGYYMLDERARTLFPDDAFSLVVLSDGTVTGVPQAGHPHSGAQVWVEIVGISGPAGAKFGFWDENWSQFNDTPTVSFTTNGPTNNYRFVLSEGLDFSDEDPEGHIHGRSWTADKPGDYYLSFRLVDLSTNRPGGGAWHTPSQIYTYHFQAGPSFQPTLTKELNGTCVLTWSSQMGYWTGDAQQTGIVFTVERSSTLLPQSWEVIGTVTGTTANTVTFTDLNPPNKNANYRLRYQWSTP